MYSVAGAGSEQPAFREGNPVVACRRIVPKQLPLGAGSASSSLIEISSAGLEEMPVECLERIDARYWDEESTPCGPQQSLDVALLVGTSHPTEVLSEQVMALQAEELLGELPLPTLENLDHRDARVVIRDPSWHATELLEGPPVSLHERLRAFASTLPAACRDARCP